MKKLILFLTLLLLIGGQLLISASPTGAVTTPTPTKKPTSTPTSSENRAEEAIKERLQEAIEKGQKKAFWGTLKQISNTTLTLETPRGERLVKTGEETKIFLDKKEVKFADLAIGNFVIAIGSWDKSDALQAKKISAFSTPPKVSTKRQAIFGKVSQIKTEQKTLVLTHPKKPGVNYEIKVTDKTLITKKVDGKIKKLTFEAIKIGDRVVTVSSREKDTGPFTAKIIHVTAGKAIGQQEETMEKPTPTPKPKKSSPTPAE